MLRDRQHPIRTPCVCVADRKSFLTTRGRLRDAYPFVRDGVGDGRRNTGIGDRRHPTPPPTILAQKPGIRYRADRYNGRARVLRSAAPIGIPAPGGGGGGQFPNVFRRRMSRFRNRKNPTFIPRLFESVGENTSAESSVANISTDFDNRRSARFSTWQEHGQ